MVQRIHETVVGAVGVCDDEFPSLRDGDCRLGMGRRVYFRHNVCMTTGMVWYWYHANKIWYWLIRTSIAVAHIPSTIKATPSSLRMSPVVPFVRLISSYWFMSAEPYDSHSSLKTLCWQKRDR
eukprot:scaffold1522_cov166-Amphora_coffeaeformis.AAC.5